MCLNLIAYHAHPKYKAIIAFNRDELHIRPTAPLDFWKDSPSILGGRDRINNGSWFAISSNGRIALVTNYRDFNRPEIGDAPSRGLLVSNFLTDKNTATHYLEDVKLKAAEYNGYNMVVGDAEQLYYYSNIENEIKEIPNGIHGLSNHLLNTPWPKVVDSKKILKDVIDNESFEIEAIFSILADQTKKADDLLPDTGLNIEFERKASPMFVLDDVYGTRSSSVLLIDYKGQVDFYERTFDNKANITSDTRKSFVLDRQ